MTLIFKKHLLFVTLFAVGLFAQQHPLFALDKEIRTEIQRLDQRLSGNRDNLEKLMRDMRSLQRKTRHIEENIKIIKENAQQAVDNTVEFQNADIANLVSIYKQLAQRMRTISQHIDANSETWNWGSKSRQCQEVGEHQEIQTVKSSDGKFTLRYLCYDGRAIHLGTQVNLPPQ